MDAGGFIASIGHEEFMKKLFLIIVFVVSLTPLLRAEEETDVFRFREPVVIEAGDNVTSAVAIGSSIQVDGTVKENAVSIGGDVTVGPQGGIEGDAVAIGGRVLRAPGAHIGGKITSIPLSMARLRKAMSVVIPTLVVGMGALIGAAIVVGSIGSIAIAILVLALFPAHTAAAREQIERHPLKTLGVGFVVLVMCFPVLLFLFITIIGIPLSFLAAALIMAALMLGTVAVGQWIGQRVAIAVRRPLSPFAAGLVGLGLLTMASAAPYIGVFLQGVIVCLALGSVAFSRFRAVP
jgi:hypothetical protein